MQQPNTSDGPSAPDACLSRSVKTLAARFSPTPAAPVAAAHHRSVVAVWSSHNAPVAEAMAMFSASNAELAAQSNELHMLHMHVTESAAACTALLEAQEESERLTQHKSRRAAEDIFHTTKCPLLARSPVRCTYPSMPWVAVMVLFSLLSPLCVTGLSEWCQVEQGLAGTTHTSASVTNASCCGPTYLPSDGSLMFNASAALQAAHGNLTRIAESWVARWSSCTTPFCKLNTFGLMVELAAWQAQAPAEALSQWGPTTVHLYDRYVCSNSAPCMNDTDCSPSEYCSAGFCLGRVTNCSAAVQCESELGAPASFQEWACASDAFQGPFCQQQCIPTFKWPWYGTVLWISVLPILLLAVDLLLYKRHPSTLRLLDLTFGSKSCIVLAGPVAYHGRLWEGITLGLMFFTAVASGVTEALKVATLGTCFTKRVMVASFIMLLVKHVPSVATLSASVTPDATAVKNIRPRVMPSHRRPW